MWIDVLSQRFFFVHREFRTVIVVLPERSAEWPRKSELLHCIESDPVSNGFFGLSWPRAP